MAKKRGAARSRINVSKEVREVLKNSPKSSAKDVLAQLQTKHPGVKFNENSLGVAFSAARKKLGLSKGRTKKVKKQAAARKVARKVRRRAAASAVAGDVSQLQAARDFVERCGSADAAVAVIRQLEALQI